MPPRLLVPCLLAALACASPVLAEAQGPVARGRAGLAPVALWAENAGPSPMSCSAALAHWYSADLGTAAPGTSLRTMLWADPGDGNVFLLNGLEDHMPVQTIWCAAADRAWVDRAVIPLDRKAGIVPAPIHVICRPEGERLACR